MPRPWELKDGLDLVTLVSFMVKLFWDTSSGQRCARGTYGLGGNSSFGRLYGSVGGGGCLIKSRNHNGEEPVAGGLLPTVPSSTFGFSLESITGNYVHREPESIRNER